jgi:IPT/TIG domain
MGLVDYVPQGFVMRFNRSALQSLWLVALLLLPGCNALNPLCGSARPSPSLSSISPTTMVFAQLPASFPLTATGGHFVASSVILFNGAALTTTVVSSSQLTADVTSSMIPAAGPFKVEVQTPSGNSGNLGCSSGGTSSAQTLTVN